MEKLISNYENSIVENNDIDRVIEHCISLLEYQFFFYKLKPSDFKRALEHVVSSIEFNLISDEQFEKRIKEEKNGKI